MSLDQCVFEIERKAEADDHAGLMEACQNLAFRMSVQPVPIEPKLAIKALMPLRNSRYFGLLRSMSQDIINDGCTTIEVVKLYAQGLIDTGEIEPAISILERHLDSSDLADAQVADAYGLLGRAWKDKAIKTRGVRDDISQLATRQSYAAYAKPFLVNTSRYYQGINMIAVAAWDNQFALSAAEHDFAMQSAKQIFEQLSGRTTDELSIWDIATAGEAAWALGDISTAAAYFMDYIEHPDVSSFQLAGTVRQLSELWRLDDSEQGRQLIAPLRARLLTKPGGSFTASPQAIVEMEQVPQDCYEKVLGQFGAMTHRSLLTALENARSVAMIKDGASGRVFGTGFVVNGGDFHPSLDGEKLILTNNHNVSEPVWSSPSDPRIRSKHPEDAVVGFELHKDNPNREWQIADIIWQSEPTRNDATLLRLFEAIPDDIAAIKISKNMPPLDDREASMVFVIGHPGGNQISFSFTDNELIDYEKSTLESSTDSSPVKIHYRAPTSGGSSGSPVFDHQWRGIGLHHSGGRSMKKLNGVMGFYSANEGIWLESICRATASEIG